MHNDIAVIVKTPINSRRAARAAVNVIREVFDRKAPSS
jgi:hypothetical protein